MHQPQRALVVSALPGSASASVAITLPDGSRRTDFDVLPLTQAVARLLVEAQAPDTAARREAQRRLCVRLNSRHTPCGAAADVLETVS